MLRGLGSFSTSDLPRIKAFKCPITFPFENRKTLMQMVEHKLRDRRTGVLQGTQVQRSLGLALLPILCMRPAVCGDWSITPSSFENVRVR